mmetsp:Transcript_58165/g.108901  ORF Transcript_58165/g.108901 Transcript_58165/m.108901 type:complete len:112 (-) Transcript_58165:147-482(-)
MDDRLYTWCFKEKHDGKDICTVSLYPPEDLQWMPLEVDGLVTIQTEFVLTGWEALLKGARGFRICCFVRKQTCIAAGGTPLPTVKESSQCTGHLGCKTSAKLPEGAPSALH